MLSESLLPGETMRNFQADGRFFLHTCCSKRQSGQTLVLDWSNAPRTQTSNTTSSSRCKLCDSHVSMSEMAVRMPLLVFLCCPDTGFFRSLSVSTVLQVDFVPAPDLEDDAAKEDSAANLLGLEALPLVLTRASSPDWTVTRSTSGVWSKA